MVGCLRVRSGLFQRAPPGTQLTPDFEESKQRPLNSFEQVPDDGDA
jgi:hypothetical protein